MCAEVPKFYEWLESKIQHTRYSVQEKKDMVNQAIIAGLLLVTFGMCIASGYAGSSYLLGAFASGMAFSGVPHCEELWCDIPSPQRSCLCALVCPVAMPHWIVDVRWTWPGLVRPLGWQRPALSHANSVPSLPCMRPGTSTSP